MYAVEDDTVYALLYSGNEVTVPSPIPSSLLSRKLSIHMKVLFVSK